MDESIAFALPSKYSIFHRYWICQHSLNPQRRQLYGNLTFSMEHGSSGSTIYKCRIVPDDPGKDNGIFYAMKVISYIREVQDKKGKQYRPINPYTKTFQQIQTQYLVLQILSKCHRVAKFKEIIHENPKRDDDKEFFYSFLGKSKSLGQRYVCFITEFCNGGNLDSKIQNNNGPLSQKQVITYASQILEGLLELKKKKIIHRDLRPCNILLHNDEIKFSDFDSAFIGGKSNWKDVKNGIDIQSSPPQIIELASKPDRQLMRYDSQQLYQRQEKSDIYFFGLALFKMIYGYSYEKFSKSTLLNLISEMINTSDHNQKLLELMVQCLEEKIEKRIDFFSLFNDFRKIQKQKYYNERCIDKIYLSEEPLCFASFKTLDTEAEILSRSNDSPSKNTSLSFGGAEIDFENQLKKSSKNRLTKLFKDSFTKKNYTDLDALWKKVEEEKREQQKFINMMEEFVRTISIRSFYYECLYKTILGINVKSIRSKQSKQAIKHSKFLLEQELTIVLSFFFKILYKAPFKRDKHYNSENLPYETRRLFKNIIKSDIIQNKMHCYFGKSRQYDYKESKTTIKICEFFNKEYGDGENFQPIFNNIKILIQSIQQNLNFLLKDTVIKLRLAYQTIQNEGNNIKQILFILIVLQQQNLTNLRKNDIVVIWQRLLPLLNEEIELDAKEAQIIFGEYSQLYSQDVLYVTTQSNILSVALYAVNENGYKDIIQEDKQENDEKMENIEISQIADRTVNNSLQDQLYTEL